MVTWLVRTKGLHRFQRTPHALRERGREQHCRKGKQSVAGRRGSARRRTCVQWRHLPQRAFGEEASVHMDWYGTFVTTPTLAAHKGRSSSVRVQTDVRNMADEGGAYELRVQVLDENRRIVTEHKAVRAWKHKVRYSSNLVTD